MNFSFWRYHCILVELLYVLCSTPFMLVGSYLRNLGFVWCAMVCCVVWRYHWLGDVLLRERMGFEYWGRRSWRMWNVGKSLGPTSDGVRNKEVTFVEVLWRNQQVEEVIYKWRIERRHEETLSCPFPIYSSLRSIKSSTPPLCLMHSCLRS